MQHGSIHVLARLAAPAQVWHVRRCSGSSCVVTSPNFRKDVLRYPEASSSMFQCCHQVMYMEGEGHLLRSEAEAAGVSPQVLQVVST